MIAIYLSGPITHDGRQVFRRINEAANYHVKCMMAGFFPYTPHLLSLADMISDTPISYESWMSADFYWIDKCDMVVRLPGASSGADREVKYARKRGKCVMTWEQFEKESLNGTQGKVVTDEGVEFQGRRVVPYVVSRERSDTKPSNKTAKGKGQVSKRVRGGKSL